MTNYASDVIRPGQRGTTGARPGPPAMYSVLALTHSCRVCGSYAHDVVCGWCYRACMRKKPFSSYLRATAALAIWRPKREEDPTFMVYPCKVGDHYHLGHASGELAEHLQRFVGQLHHHTSGNVSKRFTANKGRLTSIAQALLDSPSDNVPRCTIAASVDWGGLNTNSRNTQLRKMLVELETAGAIRRDGERNVIITDRTVLTWHLVLDPSGVE